MFLVTYGCYKCETGCIPRPAALDDLERSLSANQACPMYGNMVHNTEVLIG